MADSTLTFLDSYCERAGDAGLWAEPLNAVTNLFFLWAAWRCYRETVPLHGRPFRQVGDIWLLMAALFAIGIGSGLWHTYATLKTMWADVIPITLFINIYLLSAMRRILGLSWAGTGLGFAGYWALTVLGQTYLPPDMLNGSVMYGPTYVTLVVLTAAIVRTDRKAGMEFVTLLEIFSLSLVFRTIDLWVCAFNPVGTHFLWHTLNAYMLYRFLKVLTTRLR